MPAGLLFVPPAHGDGVADRLAIGDGRLLRLDRHAEPVGEPLGRSRANAFRPARTASFRTSRRPGHKESARSSSQSLASALASLHLVLAVLDANGEALSRRRSGWDRRRAPARSRPSAKRSPVARSSSRAKATVSPSSARVDFRRCRPHKPRESADALLDAARVDDGRPVGEGAAQHPRQRQLAPVRGVDRADHLRQSRALVLDAEPLARMSDARRLVPQRLEESASRRGLRSPSPAAPARPAPRAIRAPDRRTRGPSADRCR